MSITQNVQQILKTLESGNCFGEKVTLVAATKMQTPEQINEAIAAGIEAIGENWVQEFREKYDLVQGAQRHFIGHLQTNKVKYLIGKTDLYHSVDRMSLAEELSKRSKNAQITSNALVQVNIGCEESKGGFELSKAFDAYQTIATMDGICVQGFMAMLPVEGSEQYKLSLVQQMRKLYEKAKAQDENIQYLSMGMSGDYALCLQGGANMVRIGSTIFGARHY